MSFGPTTCTAPSSGRSVTVMIIKEPGPSVGRPQVISTLSKSPLANRSRMARWIVGKLSESPAVSPLLARIASRETRAAPRTSTESGTRQRPAAAGSWAKSGTPANSEMASATNGTRCIDGIYTGPVRTGWILSGRGILVRVCGAGQALGELAGTLNSSFVPSLDTSISISSPRLNSAVRILSERGSSIQRWMARLRGRAP